MSNIPEKLQDHQDRKLLLQEIRGKFNANDKIQTLSGLSGIGKSQLAYQWGRESRNGSYLIEAGSRESYKSSINDLCGTLKIGTDNLSIQEKANQICKKLSGQDVRLVIDDAPNQDSVKEFFDDDLNSQEIPNILITSQNDQWQDAKVTKMDGGYHKDEALEYVKNVLSSEAGRANDTDKDINNLTNLLSCHPLALCQATYCIKTENISIKQYITDYRTISRRREDFLGKEDETNLEKTVLTTFLLSIAKVMSKSEQAAEILQKSTFYNKYHLNIRDIFGISGEDEFTVREILKSYSLIRFTDGMFKKFRMHDLLRDVILINFNQNQSLNENYNDVVSNLAEKLKFNQDSSLPQQDRVLASQHFVRILEIKKLYPSVTLNENLQTLTARYINANLYARKDLLEFTKEIDRLIDGKLISEDLLDIFAEKILGQALKEFKEAREVSNFDYNQIARERGKTEAKRLYKILKNINSKHKLIKKFSEKVIAIAQKMSNSDNVNKIKVKALTLLKDYNEAKKLLGEISDKEFLSELVELFDDKTPLPFQKIILKKVVTLYEEGSEQHKKVKTILAKVNSKLKSNISGFFKSTSEKKQGIDSRKDSGIGSQDRDDSSSPNPNPAREKNKNTKQLFEILEARKKINLTFITLTQLIKNGADLYAKSNKLGFIGHYPIHLAAYPGKQHLMSQILDSFDDPQERYKYLKLENRQKQNALECLIENDKATSELTDGTKKAIKKIFAYLDHNQQREYLDNALKKNPDHDFLKQMRSEMDAGQFVEMNQKRKEENAKMHIAAMDDSDQMEVLSDVRQGQFFTVRVSYEGPEEIPVLNVANSGCRLPTATKDANQGDHVIAYVLLLNSLNGYKGEDIKKLPQLLCETFCAILPDEREFFEQKRKDIEEKIKTQSQARKDGVSASIIASKDGTPSQEITANLKQSQIESIARYLEDVIDLFIKKVNKLENETFVQSRKSGIMGFVTEKMKLLVNKEVESFFRVKNSIAQSSSDNVLENLKAIVKDKVDKGLKDKAEMVTNEDLTKIAKSILTEIKTQGLNIPKDKKTQNFFEDLLKSITPLKKYNEGDAIKKIEELINGDKFKYPDKDILTKIGKYSSQLFDYPKVNKPDQDDVNVLFETIPKHMIIIFAAFKKLQGLQPKNKEIIYDAFLDQILKLQLWQDHEMIDENGTEFKLNRDFLKEMVAKYANIDDSFSFSMEKSLDHPKKLSNKDRISQNKRKAPSDPDQKDDETPSGSVKKPRLDPKNQQKSSKEKCRK